MLPRLTRFSLISYFGEHPERKRQHQKHDDVFCPSVDIGCPSFAVPIAWTHLVPRNLYFLCWPHMQNLTLDQIERAIEKSEPDDQRRLLARLPKLSGLSSLDFALLKLAEPSLYDRL